MGTRYTHGFTIIEVMLFLAVSGALAVGILATSSIAINQQRYRDALNSLQAVMQQQYNQTANIINDRSGDIYRCDSSGITDTGDNSNAAQPRGTSDCLVMGRTIEFGAGGKDISLQTVVGYRLAGEQDDTNDDLDALRQYRLFVSDTNSVNTEVAWGANVRLKDSGVKPFYFFILRSPLTGSLRTFSASGQITDGKLDTELIDKTNMGEKTVCIESGGFTIASTLGVMVRANASSSGAIELLGDGQAC